MSEAATVAGYLVRRKHRGDPAPPGGAVYEDDLVVTRASRALTAAAPIDHVYLVVMGHHVPHLHVHLASRYGNPPREYRGMRVDE